MLGGQAGWQHPITPANATIQRRKLLIELPVGPALMQLVEIPIGLSIGLSSELPIAHPVAPPVKLRMELPLGLLADLLTGSPI